MTDPIEAYVPLSWMFKADGEWHPQIRAKMVGEPLLDSGLVKLLLHDDGSVTWETPDPTTEEER